MKKLLLTALYNLNLDINLEDVVFIGSGLCGSAFRYKDRVFKLTRDNSDAYVAEQIMQNPNRFTCFAKVFSVREVVINTLYEQDVTYYLIETEYCGDTVCDKYGEGSKVEMMMRDLTSYYCDFFHANMERNYDKIPKPNGNYSKNLSVKPLNTSVIKIHKWYRTLVKEFQQLGNNNFDYHTRNVCYSRKLGFKVIDFGYAGTNDAHLFPSQIDAIKVNTENKIEIVESLCINF